MTAVPNAQQAIRALDDLQHQVAERAAVRISSPLAREDALTLAIDLHRLDEITRWCRDASIALARTAEPPITWPELQEVLGISDSTLYSRLRTWRPQEDRR